MGWSIGFDSKWQRDIGYGVPAICDHPGCDTKIDRGLPYVCGGEPYGGDIGCGLHFCDEHLGYYPGEITPQLCSRCGCREETFTPKPDIARWVYFKLNDESWAEWREENADKIAAMKLIVDGLSPEDIESFKQDLEYWK